MGQGGKALSEPVRRLKFGTNTTMAFLVSVIGQVMGWVGTKEIYLHAIQSSTSPGAAFLGTATFFVMLSSIIVGLGALKMNTAYTFFVARGAPKRTLTGTYLLFNLLSFSALSTLVVILAVIFNWFPGYNSSLVLIMLLPVVGIPASVYAVLQNVEGRTAIGQIPVLIEVSVRISLIVFFAQEFNNQNIYTSFGHSLVFDIALAYFLGGVASLLYSLPVLREVSLERFVPTLKDMATFALPLMGGMFFTYAAGMIVPVIVRILAGPTVLLYYSSDNAFLILLMFIPSAVCTPLFPDLARMHVRGEDDQLKLRIRQSIRYTLMLLAPAMIAIAVFRVDLLNIMYSGAVVAMGGTALIIFAIAVLPTALFRITATALDSVGLQKRELYISFVQFVVVVAATWALTPQYLVLGAAAAMLIAMSASLGMNAYWLHRYLPLSFPLRAIVTVLLASLATFLLLSSANFSHLLGGIGLHLAVDKWYVLLPVIMSGLFLYLLILAAVGELAKQDVLDLVRTLGLPESWGKPFTRLCWRVSWPVEGHPPEGPEL